MLYYYMTNYRLSCIIGTSLLFFILSLPCSYKLTNKFINTYSKTGPTNLGIFLHSVMFLIILLIIKQNKRENFITCE